MLHFKFQCPNCKTELEAPPKVAGKKTTCPECGHKFTIPAWKPEKKSGRRPAGSSPTSSGGKGFVKAAILLLLATLVVLGVILAKRTELPVKEQQGKGPQLSEQLEKERAEEERLAREAEQRAQELADLFNRAQTCQQQALSGELPLDQAFEVSDKIVPMLAETEHADEMSALRVELEAARREAVSQAKDALVEAAQAHIDTHDYDAAADVYELYSGPFMPELLDFCEEQASTLRETAKERHATRLRFLSAAADDLLERNIRSAKNLLQADPQRQYLIDMAETLARLENLRNALTEAFKNKIGETITLTINGRKHDAALLGVVDDTILVQTEQDGQAIKGKFPIVKLALEDHYQALADEDLLAATIYAVGRSLSDRKFDQALDYIDEGGDEADVLRDYVVELGKKAERLATLKTKPDEETEEDETDEDFEIKPHWVRLLVVVQDIGGRYNTRVVVRNQCKFDIKDYPLELYIFGESATRKNTYGLLKSFKTKISVQGNRKNETQEYSFNNSSRYTYDGYLAIIRHPDNSILTISASRDRYENLAEQASELVRGKMIDQ
jgi:DNA-directed RNA polymerase subunit RPC12/RpoP